MDAVRWGMRSADSAPDYQIVRVDVVAANPTVQLMRADARTETRSEIRIAGAEMLLDVIRDGVFQRGGRGVVAGLP